MEASMEVYPGITMDPAVRFGKPCIKGTRIDVATVLGRFAAGDKIEDTQGDYQLSRDQVTAARRRIVDLCGGTKARPRRNRPVYLALREMRQQALRN